MEQVDQIIIVTLREIGVEIDTSEFSSLGKFTDQMIVKSVAKCINIINGNKPKLSENLPESMAMRYRVGIDLATACKKLGYKADLGYETFLYSNEVDIRRLFMFLVENLPRARQDAGEEGIGQTSSLRFSIAKEIRRQQQLPWLPPQCAKNHLVWDGNRKTGSFHYTGGFTQFKSSNVKKSEGSRCLGLQCSPDALLSSLLELSTKLNQEIDVSNLTITQSSGNKSGNFREIIKKAQDEVNVVAENIPIKLISSPPTSSESPKEHNIFNITESVLHGGSKDREGEKEEVVDKTDDAEELVSQHEAAKEELTQTLEQLTEKHSESMIKIENASKRLNELEKNRKEKVEAVNQLKDEYLLKKKTLQLVPQEKNAVVALKEKVSDVNDENKNIKEMWADKESKLVANAERLEADLRAKELQTSEYIEDVKLMREEIAGLVSSIEVKDAIHKELNAEVDNLTSSINRNAHTQKILDLVDKIKRQKEHINSILGETKVVQKEINSFNGKIERSFIETDEIIFHDAKQNDQCRKAYKLLANLQSEFNALVRALDDVGTINRELRDIEDLLQREKEKNTPQLILKVSKDLDAVVSENDRYIAAIKAAKANKK